MPPIWNDIVSLLPTWATGGNPVVSALPKVGESISLPDSVASFAAGQPTIIACVRHCGCPFAENEVRELGELSNANPALRVVVVAMSDEADVKAWFERIGGSNFKDTGRVKLVADPTRATYAALGIGLLPTSGVLGGVVMEGVKALKEKGIVNTETVYGSNRWQNSGGLAVNTAGVVTWQHTAEHAGDMCKYDEAVKSLSLA